MPLVMPPKAADNRIGEAETNQQAIVAGTQFTGPAGELGAQQRVDRGDDRQRQRARHDQQPRSFQRLGHRQPGKIDQHGAHRRTCRRRTDHRPQHVREPDQGEPAINQHAAAEADQ